jgi:hypothetical protein
MLLDLLPVEQAAPQRPAAVVGGSLLLDLWTPPPVDSPTFDDIHPSINQDLVRRLAEALRRKRQQRLLLLLGGLDG